MRGSKLPSASGLCVIMGALLWFWMIIGVACHVISKWIGGS
jgi:hypothetical protein